MPKVKGWLELPLKARGEGQPLTDWLYLELRSAILEGRLPPSARLPSTRDFAAQYGVSRGTIVQVFERLQSEGYLCSRVGAGTVISGQVTPRPRSRPEAGDAPRLYSQRQGELSEAESVRWSGALSLFAALSNGGRRLAGVPIQALGTPGLAARSISGFMGASGG